MDIHSLPLCPISFEIMDDPVTVRQTGTTYDRQSLRESLRRYPGLDPLTGQRFRNPLRFTANVTVRQIVELVRHDAGRPRSPPRSNTSDSLETRVKSLLLCPISQQVMEDPVIVHKSGIVYDRKSLCRELLARPNKEPQTGRTCARPLEFTSCIVTRSIIASLHGESQLRRYDDRQFHEDYHGPDGAEATRTSSPAPPAAFAGGRRSVRDRPNPPPSAPIEESSNGSGSGSGNRISPTTFDIGSRDVRNRPHPPPSASIEEHSNTRASSRPVSFSPDPPGSAAVVDRSRRDVRDRPHPPPSAPIEEHSSTSIGSRSASLGPDPPESAEVPRRCCCCWWCLCYLGMCLCWC